MDFTRKNFVSLRTNGTVVDIHIQVPVLVGMELIQHFEKGVNEFHLTPNIIETLEVTLPEQESKEPEKPKRSKK